MKFKIVIMLLLVAVGCQKSSQEDSTQDVQRIIVDLTKVEPDLLMSELFSGIDYLPLNTPEGLTIGHITKIMNHEHFISFYDRARNSGWIFDFDGNYINEIRVPHGNGPGELMHMTDLVVTREQQIFALGAHKIVGYDKNGVFTDEIRLDYFAYNFTYSSDEDLFITSAENDLNMGLNNEHAGYNLIYVNKEGVITDSQLPIEEGRGYMRQVPPNRFPLFQDIELYSPHLIDTVYTIDRGEVFPRYVLDFGDHSLTEEVFSRRTRYGNNQFDWVDFFREEIEANRYVSGVQVFNETENVVHFRFGNGENMYNAFFNKKSGITRLGPARLINDIDFGFVPFIYESSDNALMAVINPGELIQHVEYIQENNVDRYEEPRMGKLIALTDTLEEYGNPVLKIAYFK